jgi:segregation and condensation protein B
VDPSPLLPLAGISTEDLDRRIYQLEGILFIAREPISSRKLSEMAELADGTEARTLIRYLNERYDQQQRAFRLERVAGGYQLMTRPEFTSWLQSMNHVPAAVRLSQPSMETLAVVAYQQPVLRVEVEAIRGVACGEVLRHLMEQGLVRITGRSEELGRPYLYGTTREFLLTFGMADIEEIPPMDRRHALSPSA